MILNKKGSRLNIARLSKKILFFISPIAIFISLTFGNGGDIQAFILNALLSETPTIYASHYNNRISVLPTVGEWIFSSLNTTFIILGTVIAFIVSEKISARKFAAYTIISVFVGLMSIDMFFMLKQDIAFVSTAFAENLASNFFGSIIGGLILTLVVHYSGILVLFLPFSKVTNKLFAALFTVTIGLLVSMVTFSASVFFYGTLPVKMRAIISSPFSTVIASDKINSDDNVGSFLLFHNEGIKGNISFRNPSSQLTTKWKKTKKAENYMAEIRLFKNCQFKQRDWKQLISSPALKLVEASEFEAFYDEGTVDLESFNDKDNKLGLKSSTHATINQLSIDRNPQRDSDDYSITLFVDDEFEFKTSISDSLNIFFSAGLAEVLDGGLVKRSDRLLTLKIDGSKYLLHAKTKDRPFEDQTSECTAITELSELDQFNTLALDDDISLDLVVSFIKQASKSVIYGDESSELEIKNGNGWLTFKNLDWNDLQGSQLGETKFVVFSENVQLLEIADQEIEVTDFDTISAFGEFQVSFIDDGTLQYMGSARPIWKNDTRLNPTRWENSNLTIFLFVISLIGSLLLYFLSQLFSILRDDTQIIYWK